MTRDDIIRMARDCSLADGGTEFQTLLERFAALVAAAEREACAKVCEERSHRSDDMGAICAAAIRARSEK